MKRDLNFSLDTLQAQELLIDNQIDIASPSLIINLSKEPIYLLIDNSIINQFESRLLYNQTLLSRKAQACIIKLPNETKNWLDTPQMIREEIQEKWQTAFNLYPHIGELKKLDMYKSPKDIINGFELNLWFLKEKSLGRIHKEHSFTEVHLQVLGIGKMQKYLKQERSSLYETAFMTPGFTHYPFYDKHIQYPWHSYDAITNCIWMAIEKH